MEYAAEPHRTDHDYLSSELAASPAISFCAIISALSFAIDLTEGAVPGHALRTCVIGMRIANAIGLPLDQATALHRALMLKDVVYIDSPRALPSVSSNEGRASKSAKLLDWSGPHRPTFGGVNFSWLDILPQSSRIQQLARLGRMALQQRQVSFERSMLRSVRGAGIVQKLGLSQETVRAIDSVEEHWDGSGYPERLKGPDIPLLGRILGVAQHLDVCASEQDRDTAIRELHERSSRWFDPSLVRVVDGLENRNGLWQQCLASDGTDMARRLALDLEPAQSHASGHTDVDRICEAFADVVDAKSPFTYRHSVGVADIATSMATVLQLAPDRVQLVRRAALLHDLGKLAIPNSILDKPGTLTPEEWDIVVQHPRLTREILNRIDSFAELAEIAGAHHEKLDGSGYPDGLTASQLSLEARIVAAADVYQALIEERPYRKGLTHSEAMKVLHRLAGIKLDAHCVAAIAVARDPWTVWTPTTRVDVAGPRRRPQLDAATARETAFSA
jgi:putative nucleotidyltransferase with HDIG domain